jgi:3-dehydroquinate dehydratase-1
MIGETFLAGTAKHISVAGRVLGGGRLPLVCIPLTAGSRQKLLAELDRILRLQPNLIEWRADYFGGLADLPGVVRLARELQSAAGDIPLIFTLRSVREGGQPTSLDDAGTAAVGVAICEASAAGFIDLEMSLPQLQFAQLSRAAHDNSVQRILSYHDFEGTPDAAQLLAKFALAQQLGGDIAKVAVMPKNPDDVLTLLAATLCASRQLDIPLVGISMGQYGAVSRLFGWMFGSSITFAAGENASAPGQLAMSDLKMLLAAIDRDR